MFFFTPGLRLHLFSTHPPCGDATIAPKKKRTCAEDASPPPSKIARLSSFDQHRTGAKCVAGEEVDALGRGGREYHTSLGAIRRKPGEAFSLCRKMLWNTLLCPLLKALNKRSWLFYSLYLRLSLQLYRISSHRVEHMPSFLPLPPRLPESLDSLFPFSLVG